MHHPPLEAISAVDDEINNGDYWNWDGSGRLRYGCLDGGWIAYLANDSGARLRLHAWAFSRGLPLTGRGVLNWDDVTFSLPVWFGTPVSPTAATFAAHAQPAHADRSDRADRSHPRRAR